MQRIARKTLYYDIDYGSRVSIAIIYLSLSQSPHTHTHTHTDAVYNWLVEVFSEHRQCTRYDGTTSELLNISASIIQGSAIGPVSYVVNAADLTTATQLIRRPRRHDRTLTVKSDAIKLIIRQLFKDIIMQQFLICICITDIIVNSPLFHVSSHKAPKSNYP